MNAFYCLTFSKAFVTIIRVSLEKEKSLIHVMQVLKSTCDLVEHSLDFSLTFSSRSPRTLSPHRKILWAFDAWMSNDRGLCNRPNVSKFDHVGPFLNLVD